jgi:insulin receptor
LDIRGNPDNMEKLRGCRVVEGQLNIVVMENVTPRAFENVSFPELREVTDFIKIYRFELFFNRIYINMNVESKIFGIP